MRRRGSHRRRGCRWRPSLAGTLAGRVLLLNLGRALALGQLECQNHRDPFPVAPPGHHRCEAWEHRAVDLEGISALLTEQGWALLESLPPYDEARSLALGEELRAAGHPAPLVAAALTQARLRAAASAKFGPFAASMLFT